MHVHLREPGLEEDETIASGTAAAAGRRLHLDRLHPQHRSAHRQPGRPSSSSATRPPWPATATCSSSACVSKNREGKELAEIGQLVEAGAVAFSDDGAPVYDAELMRRAFEYCLMFDKPVLNHAEIRELTQQRRDARGAGLAGAGAAGHSRRRRRRDDQPRHRPGRGHRRPAARHARLHRRTASTPCGGRSSAACGSPPRPRRTTSPSPTSACGPSTPTTR